MITNIIPVILSGGTGSRLWPLSRASYPKQYLEIDSNEALTFLQCTVNRIKSALNQYDTFIYKTKVNNNSNNDIISNMTSETNSTGFTDGGSLTSSMNIQPPEQMPKEILETVFYTVTSVLLIIKMVIKISIIAINKSPTVTPLSLKFITTFFPIIDLRSGFNFLPIN